MVFEGVRQLFSDIGISASPIPGSYSLIIITFVYALALTVYAFFIWFFCKNISKRDLMKLNLSKYNDSNWPNLDKFFASILYIIEYIILLPFFVFVWFFVLAAIIVIMSPETQNIQLALMASAAIVTATRIVAYYKEDLAQDIAKLFPLTLLAVSLTTPGFFSIERMLDSFSEIPLLLNDIWIFFILTMGVELVLRLLQLIQDYFLPEKVIG